MSYGTILIYNLDSTSAHLKVPSKPGNMRGYNKFSFHPMGERKSYWKPL